MVDSKTQVMNNKKKPVKKAAPKKAAKKPLLPKAKAKKQEIKKPVKKQAKEKEKPKAKGRVGIDPFKKGQTKNLQPAKVEKKIAKTPVIDSQLMQEISTEFNRLSDRDKRVLVAQDALKYLKGGIVEPTVGEYVQVTKSQNNSVQKDILTGILRCKACQKGILLIAAVGREDHVPHSSLKHLSDGELIYSRLDFFNINQLDLMETAFEKEITNVFNSHLNSEAGRRDQTVVIKPTPIATKAIKFGSSYSEPAKRMQGILENIIDNNGEFRP